MNRHDLEACARQLLAGEITVERFVGLIGQPRALAIGEATLDLDRDRRCGFGEVIYGEGKSVETLEKIFRALLDRGLDVLATRISREKAESLCRLLPRARYNPLGRTLRVAAKSVRPVARGRVAVVTAGTSDLAVAEEARETLDWMGVEAHVVHDVGVAGPHRIVEHVERLRSCDAVVVIAGMEGALASVVGGHLACPVIGVPTSVGYGSSLAGLTALLGMLNSCAANVGVVNIDAGFKGAYLAGMIAARAAAARESALDEKR